MDALTHIRKLCEDEGWSASTLDSLMQRFIFETGQASQFASFLESVVAEQRKESGEGRMYCGYCLGTAVYNEAQMRWEHAEDGERITNISAGDYVSASHNKAGTRVPTHDLTDDSDN